MVPLSVTGVIGGECEKVLEGQVTAHDMLIYPRWSSEVETTF